MISCKSLRPGDLRGMCRIEWRPRALARFEQRAGPQALGDRKRELEFTLLEQAPGKPVVVERPRRECSAAFAGPS